MGVPCAKSDALAAVISAARVALKMDGSDMGFLSGQATPMNLYQFPASHYSQLLTTSPFSATMG